MSLPRPVKAVVFDMDGLLVDTETVVFAAMQRAAAGFGGEMPFAIFKRMVGLQHAHSDHIVVEHFGAGFDLDALDAANLPRAIATSSSLASVHHSLGRHGLVERFHALITKDVQTLGKPHPEPFLKAAAALGVAPADCLALEDSHNGVRAASSAGMMTVMVPDMLDPTEEMHSLCVRIAADLHEVRGWIEAA